MNKLLLLCFIILLSCNDETFVENSSQQSTNSPLTRFGGDNIYDVLGMSYDATESYLSDIAVRLPVINLSNIEVDRIITSTASGSNGGFYYGANSEEYVKDIVKKTSVSSGASSSLFGGTLSITNNLNSKYSYSSQYSFASHDEVFRIKYLRLNADISLLKQNLIHTFLEDLNNYSPEQFIKSYGTHVLCDVSIGGRLNIIYRSIIYKENSTTMKTKIVKSGLNATIPKIIKFNASTDSEITVTESDTKKNENWSLFVQSFGGKAINSTYTASSSVPTIDLGAWQNSITLNNAALVNIGWDKAIPIYELITDPIKKELVKQAMTEYIEKKKMEVLPISIVHQSFNGEDHYYDTSYSPTYGGLGQWKYEHPVFAVYSKQEPQTVPLYRYWNGQDHFYTTDYCPGGIHDWKLECILGYVYQNPHDEAIPLYRAWHNKTYNHFYSTTYSPTYGGEGQWKYECISCYVLPLDN